MPYYHIVMSHCSILSLPDWMKNPEFGSVTSLTTCLSLSYRPWDSVTPFHFENKWMNKCMNMVLNMGSDFSVAFLITCNYTMYFRSSLSLYSFSVHILSWQRNLFKFLILFVPFYCTIEYCTSVLLPCTGTALSGKVFSF